MMVKNFVVNKKIATFGEVNNKTIFLKYDYELSKV